MSKTTTTSDPVLARIMHLERRLSTVESKNTTHLKLACDAGGELVLRRTLYAGLWLAVDRSGGRQWYFNFGSEYTVDPAGRKIPPLPGNLAAGHMCGDVFHPLEDALPERFVGGFGAARVSIGNASG